MMMLLVHDDVFVYTPMEQVVRIDLNVCDHDRALFGASDPFDTQPGYTTA